MSPPINLGPADDDFDDADMATPAPQPGGHADEQTPDDLAIASSTKASNGGTMPSTQSAANNGLFQVTARSGLSLRAGPGTEFQVIGLLPFGTSVHVIQREGAWALVDRKGDGATDGHVFASYLSEASTVSAPAPAALTTGAIYESIDTTVLQTIMNRCAGVRIVSKLDLSEVAYALNQSMQLANATSRLRQIAFLSQAVIETDYFRTFAEYGKGKGKVYAPYYGRGIHQLTWKGTYASCSQAIFHDDRLVQDPDLILKDIETNIKATAWYWRDYKPFNRLADLGDIDSIIHLLYGGTINSPSKDVRHSVELRRGYYKTIGLIIV